MMRVQVSADTALCLCQCRCTEYAGEHRYVCKFCGNLWLHGDYAHSPPIASDQRIVARD